MCLNESLIQRAEHGANFHSNWGQLGYATFFLLHRHASPDSVGKRLTEINDKNMTAFHMDYSLQAISMNHFYNERNEPNSNLQACRLFSIAVLVVLIIACINYVNLVTARMSKRNRELFVRNLFGASRISLFAQAMLESMLLFLASLALATLILFVIFPLFKEISAKEIELNLFSIETLAVYGLVFLTVNLFAGIFPALKLSARRSKSLSVYSAARGSSGAWLRRLLVSLQFAATAMLIMSAIVITRQMKFIQSKDLGYDKENLIDVTLTSGMRQNVEKMKAELLMEPDVLGACFASQDICGAFTAVGWRDSLMITMIEVDKDFIKTMGMELVEGKDFEGAPSDAHKIILNRNAIDAMGLHDPVGKPFQPPSQTPFRVSRPSRGFPWFVSPFGTQITRITRISADLFLASYM